MGHICIRLVVHDIFYLPILLGCMIPITICVFYTVPLLCKVKKICHTTYKTQVGARNYLSCGHHQLLRYGWILCFCISFRYKLLVLNCPRYINHVTCVTIFLLEINIVQKWWTAKKHLCRKENDLKKRSTTLHKNRTNRGKKHQREITILLLNL